ncbi:MAG TPA: hypothetical protein PLP91_05240 [Plasticicumulans sp.]|nr:hypothetical protein [Plasticicumulans sp.]
MALDIDAFRAAAQRMQHRTADVPVPELAALLPDADPATLVVTVRGLSHHEMAAAHEFADRDFIRLLKDLMEALAERSGAKTIAGTIYECMFVGERTPTDTALRIAKLMSGAVNPQIDLDAAIQIAEGFPEVFKRLTDKIKILTDGGATLGKPLRCTETTAS